MNHEEFKVDNPEPFQWSKRGIVELTDKIIISQRVIDYYKPTLAVLILDWATELEKEHDAIIDKIEITAWQWGFDENINSLMFRWTSSLGVFQRPYMVKETETGAYEFVPGLAPPA